MMALSVSKICTKCKEDLCLSMYSFKDKEKTKLRTWCKPCNNKHTAKNKYKYRESHKNSQEVYRICNKEYYAFRNSIYRSFKLQATPHWTDLDKIKLLYTKAKWLEKLTGKKYHVDHIIPLQGENVCGLHIWENLQILESSINLAKGNKL